MLSARPSFPATNPHCMCVCVINSFNELRNRYGRFQRDTGRVFLATRDVLNCYSVMAVVEVAIIRF